MKRSLHFEASAYLQTLLGRELFRSEELAIVELVKNAYDSGASNAVIAIRPRSPREPGSIEIRDDGSGMTLEEFERRFMFAGYSERPQELLNERIPTGEKGIGRFASDRLGSTLTVFTKTAASAEVLIVSIDWKSFNDRAKRFRDVSADVKIGTDQEFATSTGTLLQIGGLREPWDRGQLLSLRSALSHLIDPFKAPENFSIDLQIPARPELSGPVNHRPVEDNDIEVGFQVLADGRVKRWRTGKFYENQREEEVWAPSVDASPLKGLKGRFLYYLKKPSKAQAHGTPYGVRVYRDGFRVEPFGSQAADWLGIEAKRAKRAGHAHVVPSRLFGYVSISRRQHLGLKDTTSREALIDTNEARAMVHVLQGQFKYLENSIQVDVARPRWERKGEEKALKLERARLQALSLMSTGLGHELRQPLQAIRMEAENIRDKLKQLGIEDPDINEAQQNIDEDIGRIDRNIKLIASISSGSLDNASDLDLSTVIREHAKLFAPRCAAQDIELRTYIPEVQCGRLSDALISIVFINLVKNAIDAFALVDDDRAKRIDISLTKNHKFHILEIADNALGISEDIRPKIFKKFTTPQKTGGWGVGLSNCKVFVESHGGKISFDSEEGRGTIFRVELPDQ